MRRKLFVTVLLATLTFAILPALASDAWQMERKYNRLECLLGDCNQEWLLDQMTPWDGYDHRDPKFCARNNANWLECDHCADRQFYDTTDTQIHRQAHQYCAMRFAPVGGPDHSLLVQAQLPTKWCP